MTVIEHRSTPPDARSGAAWEQLQTLLIAGESVVAFALEHRFYALLHRRHMAAATTGRFIYMRRPLLGGYHPVTIRWQDVKDARLTVGMFSATVSLTYSANLSDTAGGEGDTEVLQVPSLTRPEAQALYRECQAQEQSWREKRRVRSIEEMRAQAGGVQVATGVYPQHGSEQTGGDPLPPAGGGSDDPAGRLARAKAMLADGLITDAEYEALKARIIGAL